jgi:hypothetical protein
MKSRGETSWDCAEFSKHTDFSKLPKKLKTASAQLAALRYLQSLQPAGVKTASDSALGKLMLKLASGCPLLPAIAAAVPELDGKQIVKLAMNILKAAAEGVHNDGNLKPSAATENPREIKLAPSGSKVTPTTSIPEVK